MIIRGDCLMVCCVLSNLIFNVMCYMLVVGSIIVLIVRFEGDVLVVVENDGFEILVEYLFYLFDWFY